MPLVICIDIDSTCTHDQSSPDPGGTRGPVPWNLATRAPARLWLQLHQCIIKAYMYMYVRYNICHVVGESLIVP